MGRFAASALTDYLSGMLIGSEVKAGLQRFKVPDPQQPILVLGSAQLTNRYATALTTFGLTAQEIPGDAVFGGLLTIAHSAGLLAPNSQID